MTEPTPLTHLADMAASQGATREQMLFYQANYTHALLLEVLREFGGEVRLPAGHHDRMQEAMSSSAETVMTIVDQDTGELVVSVTPTPDAYREGGPGPGLHCGTFWERYRDDDSPPGPRHRIERVDAAGMAELRPLNGGLTIFVEGNKLLKGLDGWRRA